MWRRRMKKMKKEKRKRKTLYCFHIGTDFSM
jgi:hypothetical protein